jgi:hypothetical protein
MAAQEQRKADLRLEPRDRSGDERLSDAERLGGLGEAAMAGDVAKDVEMPRVHRPCPI